jgi:hypothetical protein
MKLTLCLIKHHAMNIYGRVEVLLNVLLTLAGSGGKLIASHYTNPWGKYPQCPLSWRWGRPQSRYGCCGEEVNLYHSPRN